MILVIINQEKVPLLDSVTNHQKIVTFSFDAEDPPVMIYLVVFQQMQNIKEKVENVQ